MLDKLIEYQSVDAELRAIEQELSGSEDRKKGVAAKKFLDTVNDVLAELDRKAQEFDAAYKKYAEGFNQLNETQKEFEGLNDTYTEEDEINFVKKKAQELMSQLKALEEKLVRLQEEITSLTNEYNNLKKKTLVAQKQFKECGQKYTELKASKASAQAEIQARLQAIRKDIPKEVMEAYDKRRADKVFPIVYEIVTAGFCPSCRTEISMLAASKLTKDGFIVCDNCGRLIYKK